jgi:hypothetical protein
MHRAIEATCHQSLSSSGCTGYEGFKSSTLGEDEAFDLVQRNYRTRKSSSATQTELETEKAGMLFKVRWSVMEEDWMSIIPLTKENRQHGTCEVVSHQPTRMKAREAYPLRLSLSRIF